MYLNSQVTYYSKILHYFFPVFYSSFSALWQLFWKDFQVIPYLILKKRQNNRLWLRLSVKQVCFISLASLCKKLFKTCHKFNEKKSSNRFTANFRLILLMRHHQTTYLLKKKTEGNSQQAAFFWSQIYWKVHLEHVEWYLTSRGFL